MKWASAMGSDGQKGEQVVRGQRAKGKKKVVVGRLLYPSLSLRLESLPTHGPPPSVFYYFYLWAFSAVAQRLCKCGFWTSSIGTIWEPVRNAYSQAPSQTYWVRNSEGGLSQEEQVKRVVFKLQGASEALKDLLKHRRLGALLALCWLLATPPPLCH